MFDCALVSQNMYFLSVVHLLYCTSASLKFQNHEDKCGVQAAPFLWPMKSMKPTLWVERHINTGAQRPDLHCQTIAVKATPECTVLETNDRKPGYKLKGPDSVSGLMVGPAELLLTIKWNQEKESVTHIIYLLNLAAFPLEVFRSYMKHAAECDFLFVQVAEVNFVEITSERRLLEVREGLKVIVLGCFSENGLCFFNGALSWRGVQLSSCTMPIAVIRISHWTVTRNMASFL